MVTGLFIKLWQKINCKIIPFVLLLIIVISYSNNYNISIKRINQLKYYVDKFNQEDTELYVQYIPNDSAFNFLAKNIPLLEIPDKEIEEVYYFRWWTFRKHIKSTEDGFVITEFLPNVSWSGKHNTISCPAAHHIYEGRWLRNPEYIEDYINFWLTEAGESIRKYSFWIADAALAFRSVYPNDSLLSSQLPYFIDNYEKWEKSRKGSSKKLFWQFDNSDGMEFSASAQILNGGIPIKKVAAIRPSINSYMFGEANAIAEMAQLSGSADIEKKFRAKADALKNDVQRLLWNDNLNFFSVLPRNYSDTSHTVTIRELIGYTPWYFNLPDNSPEYAKAWDYVIDSTGFYAPYGLTTCEQSYPFFKINYTGWECQWNGPVWPYATTVTLKALANFLNNYSNKGIMTKEIYLKLLKQYAGSHFLVKESGDTVNWIDESQNPFTGDWITRTRMKNWEDGSWPTRLGGLERGKDYNHSGFCDLVISDLLGIKPSIENKIEVSPLTPDDWEYFCLNNLNYKGHNITLIWDKKGTKYNKGKGFMLFVDGQKEVSKNKIEKIVLTIN